MKINDVDFWKDKKAFVTGGSGFIGKHLVDKLKDLGVEVQVFVHKTQSPEKGIVGNLVSYEDSLLLHQYLDSYRPDVVFHLAAQPLVNRSEELLIETLDINIRGTYGLFSACIGIPSIQSIVHISTDKVYGNLDIITEKEIPNGVGHPYNASKLSGDIIAQMFANTFSLPITIIRNGNIYGAGDLHWERIVPGNILRVLQDIHPTLRGDGKMLRDYIHVSDIVIGFINSASFGWATEEPIILRLGSEKPVATHDVVDIILKETNRVDLSPVYEKVLPGEIVNQHIYDPTSQTKIDWYPNIGLEQGIAMSVPFYREKFKELVWKKKT